MIETPELGGESAEAVDELLAQLSMPNRVESFRASIVEALRADYTDYRSAAARARARVCMASAWASALRCSYWMAQSQRDYASALLGVKPPTFSRWAKVGRLLCGSAALREQLVAGRITMTQLEDLASGRCGSEEPAKSENEEPGAGEFMTLSITAPVPAIFYIEDSIELARGLVGTSHSDEEAVGALLAEASTESSWQVDVDAARRRFRVKEKRAARDTDPAAITRQVIDPATGKVQATDAMPANDPFEQLSLSAMGQDAQRRAAHRIHSILVRLIARRTRLESTQEDLLFEWALDGVHQRSGFRNFERFAQEILDISPSAGNARLKQARLRRQGHPVAVARSEGRVTAVQTDLLEQLHRRSHVPRSDLVHWIDYASGHTVRRLRVAINWARHQMMLDYRRWSLSHCETPNEDQLLTTEHSLESLVRKPGGEELEGALVHWEIAPRGTVQLQLTRETRDQLLVAVASMQDELRFQEEFAAPKRVPMWFALCCVFHRARHAWQVHHQAPPATLRRILDRDGYRCAAPECTQRRNLQVHHLKYRSQGGGDEESNRVTLCAFHHHHGEHGGLLRVRGRIGADGRGLIWEMGRDEEGRATRIYRDEKVLA